MKNLVLLLSLAGLGAVAAVARPAARVADLNTTVPQPAFSNDDQEFAPLGDALFFVIDDGIDGSEIWRTDGTAAGTRLVKDVCPGACSANPHALTVSMGLLFFTADDGVHGRELWRTDGTVEGTLLLADIREGMKWHEPTLMDAGGLLFFRAEDEVHGLELWATDGTPAGTRLVRDIVPGPGSSGPGLLAASGGRILFRGYDPAHGPEPWVSDGTEAGTQRLADVNPGSDSSLYYTGSDEWNRAVAFQGGFLFVADNGTTGQELWKTDGTPAGTALVKDILPGPRFPDSEPQGLTVFNGAVYFAARDSRGYELWKSDGTEAGTVLVKDIWPGTGDSSPLEITMAGNRFFFHATDGTHGAELWTSDGTAAGTSRVADLKAGPSDAFPAVNGFRPRYGLSALGNDLLFLAEDSSGLRPWRTNGTAAGTVPVSPAGLTAVLNSTKAGRVAGGQLYFLSGPKGLEVWASDGTAAGTRQVRDFVTETSAFTLREGKMDQLHTFAALGDVLLFAASDGSGSELWRTDGTPGGTWQAAGIGPPPNGSAPHEIHAVGDQAVFLAASRVWASDGAPGSAQPLTPADSQAKENLLPFGGSIFFPVSSGGDFSDSDRLWKTDGTPAGTLEVVDLATDTQSVKVAGELTASGGKIFFLPWVNGFNPDGLRVLDPDAPEVVRLPVFGGAAHLTDAGGTLFFTADFQINRLWKSDGTPEGTDPVRIDLQVGGLDADSVGYASHGELVALDDGLLLFSGDEGTAGLELWKSDGTEAGTVRVADIQPGSRGSEPRWLTRVGDQVYFSADDGTSGRELWVSDGTEAGTYQVADIVPGPGSSVPDNLAAVGSTLLFSAFDGIHGVEPWRTAGTAQGTRIVDDIAPGALSSNPTEFTAAGPNVYFAANDHSTGFELWAAPKTNVLATFGDVPTDYWAWRFVEAATAAGITSGCGAGLYCPALATNRAEMAIFLVRGIHGAGFVPPPATGTRFQDVPAGHPAAPWIEQLAADGITAGCSTQPPLYCPAAGLSRAEMAVFLLLGRHGAGYTPPPATGTRFQDVPLGYWAAPWIEQLAAEGITGGCSPTHFCPSQPLNRAEITVFLGVAFNLPLP